MKNITYNDYIQRINKVVAYINNHLDETLDLKTLANEAALSDFHFHRIFKALKGEAIGGYITRLRLEATARLLRYTALTIEEIAFNIGYETPASLSKAFKKQYGISPTEYRTNKDTYIMKKEIINPDLALKAPKIVTLEPKNLIYVALTGAYGSLDYGKAYEQLWAVIKAQKLFTKGIESICISYDDPKITEGSLQRSDVCLAIHKLATPQDEVSCKTLAGGKYAVFFYQGSYENLSQVYDTAVRWVIDQQYRLREEPFFEKYLNDARRTPKEKLKTEIYIPIN
ncbi:MULTISPECIES: GyrI-like domain-containing protein [Capnocytophaga]|uniref:AraC family transcriptional regulator n=1 Tax=Capnocytophaga TaxID=1016 RepID=UPI00020C6842|nr:MULTISPECIES: AraC family transcriptional regulator [unclassified Capnocytophaga]KHE70302.1 transcriptional regulator, effector binding domain protein [Capnocytophaga sp. oral taxon 329 str. F0087]QGS17381.1 helix-turn-helix domain-containing protein [Capnocytophaga sp. FDAARGOS_737]